MTYRRGLQNPRTVSEMTDANVLRGLASALELNLDDMSTQVAREATMTSIQIMNGAARRLTP